MAEEGALVGLSELLELIFGHIYLMSMETLVMCAVFAALIFCTLFRKYSGRRWLRPCIGAALAAWFGTVLWMTLLERVGEGVYETHWIPLHTYWAVFSGAHPEMIRSCFMNVVLFYPAGLLFAGLMPENRSFRQGLLCTVLVFALFSLSIELSQRFWQIGNCEIDDVLHNTLGAVMGFVASRLDVDGVSGENE